MKNSRLLGALCVCIFSFFTISSHATVIYDNNITIVSGDCSGEFTCRYAIADDFTLTAGATTITDVHWTGSYRELTDAALDDFTIGFYTSVAGVPSVTAFAEYDVGSVSRTDLGLGLFGYETLIPALSLLASTEYFVSIANHSDMLLDDWFWSQNGLGNGDGYLGGPNITFS